MLINTKDEVGSKVLCLRPQRQHQQVVLDAVDKIFPNESKEGGPYIYMFNSIAS